MADPIYAQTERSSGVYSVTLSDEAGDAVTTLTTLRVWLRDTVTDTYINSREAQSILNTNGGTFSAGTLTWAMDPDDHQIVGSGRQEMHEAVFEATWGSAQARTWRIYFRVTNYVPLPAA